MRISDWSSDVCSSDLHQYAAGSYFMDAFFTVAVGNTEIHQVVSEKTHYGRYTAAINAPEDGRAVTDILHHDSSWITAGRAPLFKAPPASSPRACPGVPLSFTHAFRPRVV